MATVVTGQYDTVDSICFKYYGTTLGTVEQVLKANPKLCDYAPHLPEGITVILPSLTTAAETIEVIRLWE